MFELDLVGKPPLVNPLEDDCSVKIVVPKPPNCQYNLCLKDLPPVTFLHINIGISQRDWIYGGAREQGHSASSQPGLGEYRNQMVSSRGGNVYNKPGGSLSYDYYEKGDEIFLYQRTFSVVKSPPNFLFNFSIFSFNFFNSLLLFFIWNFPLNISNHWTP